MSQGTAAPESIAIEPIAHQLVPTRHRRVASPGAPRAPPHELLVQLGDLRPAHSTR